MHIFQYSWSYNFAIILKHDHTIKIFSYTIQFSFFFKLFLKFNSIFCEFSLIHASCSLLILIFSRKSLLINQWYHNVKLWKKIFFIRSHMWSKELKIKDTWEKKLTQNQNFIKLNYPIFFYFKFIIFLMNR